jgi:signal transduction histidine kinase
LFDNAVEFSRDRAVAEITFEGVPGRPGMFVVRDNGVGFPPALGTRLFKPFERPGARPERAGPGVGLAIVARIIREHGGSVWAEGVPDRGAAFFFAIPGPSTDR